jgi:hypothetical protein
MTYLSDRHRVELLLLPMIAQSVVKAGATHPGDPTVIQAVNHFAAAIQEVVAGVDDKKRYSLLRRASRLHNAAAQPHVEAKVRVDKVGLMLFYLLNWSVECGYLVLHDGTPMAKGLDLLLPALEHAANISKLDASAQKAAVKLLTTLQADGFFQGVTT